MLRRAGTKFSLLDAVLEKIKIKIKFPSDVILKVCFGDLVVKNQIVEKEKIMHVIGYSTV